MEVLPNSLIVVKERGSPATTTWGGGTLGGVGGRRSSVQAASTPSTRSSQRRRPSSMPLFHQEEVSSIQASLVFLRRGHGGVCELGMEGPEDVGGEGTLPLGREENTTKRAEPNFAPPQPVVFSGKK